MNTKVLYLIDGLYGGGKERQLVEIIKNLKDYNCYKVGVITFNTNCHYTVVVKNYVDLFVELKKRPTRFEPLFTLRKHIREFNPDIVHTWDSLSSFYVYWYCKSMKIKFIDGSIRDAGIEKGWQYHFKRYFLKRADLVIANSFEGLKRYKVNGEVIYNAIDSERFKVPESTDLFNIVMTANFTDYKDHQTFIAASINLVKENIVDNVYLIGDGKHKQKFQNHIPLELKNKFHFTGAIRNVEDYLSKCKVGVLCSTKEYAEGISNSVLEYMASGLIPIASDVGGMREIIDNGTNGFLFKAGDSSSLYKIIKDYKNNIDYSCNITEEAKKTINEKFLLKKIINKFKNIYDIENQQY